MCIAVKHRSPGVSQFNENVRDLEVNVKWFVDLKHGTGQLIALQFITQSSFLPCVQHACLVSAFS